MFISGSLLQIEFGDGILMDPDSATQLLNNASVWISQDGLSTVFVSAWLGAKNATAMADALVPRLLVHVAVHLIAGHGLWHGVLDTLGFYVEN